MPSLNKIMLMGHAVRDAELRATPKGTPIAQFSLAVNREYKLESGEKREEVFYADVECWGKVAEVIGKYVTKGKALYVEGRCKTDSWEDKNTKEKRSRMKVVLEQFQFLGGKDGGASGGSGANEGASTQERHTPPRASGGAGAASTEDVPFGPVEGPEMG
jgi:single-strand DNA-binding protein